MNHERTRWLFIGFGLLDLVAFYRSFPTVNRIIENYEISSLIPLVLPALTLLLIISLLISGPLTIVGNRFGLVVYFFQFPFRLAFQAGLTFGFIFKVFPTQVGTMAHGMMLATVIAFEAVRLMLTIQRQRRP